MGTHLHVKAFAITVAIMMLNTYTEFSNINSLIFFSVRHDEVQAAITRLIVEIIISSPSSAGETWMALSFCPTGTYRAGIRRKSLDVKQQDITRLRAHSVIVNLHANQSDI